MFQETKNQKGQTLIETIVALFILTMGLTSGLALAIQAFGASTDVVERITAAALAREGTETVRRMRDSNWLQEKKDNNLENCNDLGTGQQCYRDWLDSTYDIRGNPAGKDFRLIFDPTSSQSKWTLSASNSSSDYRLRRASQAFTHNSGTPTNFFRKIFIFDAQTTWPYSPQSPLLLVRSVVWWHEKRCPAITDYANPTDTSCKVVTEEYLTNWRNY